MVDKTSRHSYTIEYEACTTIEYKACTIIEYKACTIIDWINDIVIFCRVSRHNRHNSNICITTTPTFQKCRHTTSLDTVVSIASDVTFIFAFSSDATFTFAFATLPGTFRRSDAIFVATRNTVAASHIHTRKCDVADTVDTQARQTSDHTRSNANLCSKSRRPNQT
jgi:hypothetical protein